MLIFFAHVSCTLLASTLSKQFTTKTSVNVFEGVRYDEDKDFMISIKLNEGSWCKLEEDIAIAYFDNQTFSIVLSQLQNAKISREEKIEIMRKYSPIPLCETGSFIKRIEVKCFLHMRKGGHLIVISTSKKFLDISLEIPRYYCSFLESVFREIPFTLIYFFLLLISIYSIYFLDKSIYLMYFDPKKLDEQEKELEKAFEKIGFDWLIQ